MYYMYARLLIVQVPSSAQNCCTYDWQLVLSSFCVLLLAVLDYGCGNGKLLKRIASCLRGPSASAATLVGADPALNSAVHHQHHNSSMSGSRQSVAEGGPKVMFTSDCSWAASLAAGSTYYSGTSSSSTSSASSSSGTSGGEGRGGCHGQTSKQQGGGGGGGCYDLVICSLVLCTLRERQ